MSAFWLFQNRIPLKNSGGLKTTLLFKKENKMRTLNMNELDIVSGGRDITSTDGSGVLTLQEIWDDMVAAGQAPAELSEAFIPLALITVPVVMSADLGWNVGQLINFICTNAEAALQSVGRSALEAATDAGQSFFKWLQSLGL